MDSRGSLAPVRRGKTGRVDEGAGRRGGAWGWAAALILLTTIAYARVGTLGFVDYDDPPYLSSNPIVLRGLTWDGLVYAFTSGVSSHLCALRKLRLLVPAIFGIGFEKRNGRVRIAASLVKSSGNGLAGDGRSRDRRGRIPVGIGIGHRLGRRDRCAAGTH